MAKLEASPTKSPRRKHRKKIPKRESKKEYYDAFRSSKSSFFGVETPGPGKDKSVPIKDTAIFVAPTVQIVDATHSPVKEPEAITRTPAPPGRRARDILSEEAESARILRNYIKGVAITEIEFEKAKMKGGAVFGQTKAQAPSAMEKEILSRESTTTRVTPTCTARRPHADANPNSNGASPNRKRKNPFTQAQGAEGFVLPPPFPIGRKKVKLAPSPRKQERAESVVRVLMEHNLDKPGPVKKLKRILPGGLEGGTGRFVSMAGSPGVAAGKHASTSDSSSTEKENLDNHSTVVKYRLPLRTTNNPTGEAITVKNPIELEGLNVAQEDIMVKKHSYNLLERVQSANPGSSSGVRGRMLPDRFFVPKTNFKNEFLLHKDLEKYFNHSTGARLSLSQHFPQAFTQPQPSDSTITYIALQIYHAAQKAGVSDTIGGWAVMPVLFSCGKSRIAGVGIVLPDVKLAARVDFRGWPFLVEGAEVVGEITIETSKPGAGDEETKDNRQRKEKDQKVLDAANTLTKLHQQHHEESDTDTDREPLIETKIVKVSESSRYNISTADYYINESSLYKYVPPSRSLNLKDLESTIMRVDYLTISFSVFNSNLSPGDMVYTENGGVGRVCARRVYTSLKDNAVPRVVTREYCAETLDGSIFCQAGDKGSRVWREDGIGSARECGKVLAAVVGTGAALVDVGLICSLRADA